MSRYTDLGAAYGRWRHAHIDYMRECQAYIQSFANGLAQYLEAPETYHDFPDGISQDPVYHRTVSIMEAYRNTHGEIDYRRPSEDRIWIDLLRTEQGNWTAAIRLTIEQDPQTHPKSAYAFPVFFSKSGDQCTMHIGDESREPIVFDVSQPTEVHRAYDFMIGWLIELYSRSPQEVSQRPAIGFLAGRT